MGTIGHHMIPSSQEMPSCMFTSPGHLQAQMTPGSNSLRIPMKENSSEVAQCRRRLQFSPHDTYMGLQRPPTVAVARRNERERNRVKLINMTFATLRDHLPHGAKSPKSKKISKVDTLKSAIDYIRQLQGMIGDPKAMQAMLENAHGSVLDDVCALSPETSVSSSTSSPSNSPCSTDSYQTAVIDEEDLIDFANWF